MIPLDELRGESPAIATVREQVRRVLERQSGARRAPPLLIQGETGTGKGLLARAIHRAGPRTRGPFVDVNCAAIPETLLEAELFGFERGAFTDARHAKAGLFLAAHQGTIFLDEVGLLPESLQGKLLKVIEEREVRRLGSTRSEAVDVWIIAATSDDLDAAVRARRFREDLYHRLAVVRVTLPPLRERGDDVLRLAEHFLATACREYGLPPRSLAPDARAALLAYPWPGNVRELGNVLERVALMAESPVVTAAMLGLPAPRPVETAAAGPGGPASLKDAVRDLEQARLLEALERTAWNITRAAEQLGITRSTLRYRIKHHGLRAARRPPVTREPIPPDTASLSSPVKTDVARTPATGVRWDRRHLALLGVALPGAGDPWPDRGGLLDEVMDKVRSFGGRVEELGPTGLVAAFGLEPEPMEDAPRRATHAAMAVLRLAEHANDRYAGAAEARLAIHAGQWVVGWLDGRPGIELEAKQDACRVLGALLSGAAAGDIAVSADAAPLLARRFELVPDDRERAYRLVPHERTGPVRTTAFAGRHRQLALLMDRSEAAAGGRGQIVGIIGDPGIGKSRLLAEFRQRVARERAGFLEGRCFPYGATTPYLPVAQLIRDACGLVEANPPPVTVEKVRERLRTLDLDGGAAPFLLHLLGVSTGTERLAGLTDEAIGIRTRDAFLELCRALSRERPLVLVVEDLHWIDRASEAYLAALADILPGLAILMVAAYRPGYRPPWIERSSATQIALGPLSLEESRAVLRSILRADDDTHPAEGLILDRAEGNPFFLEELALAVRHRRDAALAVPGTVEEVVLGRIAQLGDAPRRLLQAASVLGRDVTLPLLRHVWDGDGLEPALRELTQREFLYARTGGEDAAYGFKHGLTQEVAYRTLLEPQREALHAAAGGAFEALYADRLDEVLDRLAHHYARSPRVDRAVEFLVRFADRAARGYAHGEAVAALQEALARVERLPLGERFRRRLEIVLRLGHSLYFLGRPRERLELLLAHREAFERSGQPALTARYHLLLCTSYSLLGDRAHAAESGARALADAASAGDEATMGKAHYVLAHEDQWAGRLRDGVTHARHAVALLQDKGEPWWLGMAYWILGVLHGFMGDFEAGLEAEGRARALGEATADPRLQSYADWTTGGTLANMGEHARAIETCRRGVQASPDPVSTANGLGFLGGACLEAGHLDEAVASLERSIELFHQFRITELEGWFTALLGEAWLQRGDVERARELVARGLGLCRDTGYWVGIGFAERALGRIALAAGDPETAQTHLAEARDRFARHEARHEVGRTLLTLAESALARGDGEAARAGVLEARAIFTALRVPAYIERAEALLAAATRA